MKNENHILMLEVWLHFLNGFEPEEFLHITVIAGVVVQCRHNN